MASEITMTVSRCNWVSTAVNRACLLAKWWYTAPFVSRASDAMSSSEVAEKPWAAKRCRALSIRAR